MANNFPNLRPSMNLDFVNGVYVDPRITFTRAGTRTYFGREVVKAEENLFLNSVWAGAVTGTPGTPPTSWQFVTSGGTLTASGASIEFFAAAGQRQSISQVFNVVTGQEIRVSVDVDSVTGTGTDALVFIETLITATLSSNVRVLVSDGTGRKTASATVTASGQVRIRIGAAVESIATTDCTVSLKAPQFEIRSAATAYTPTTTQPITRYQRQLKTAAANEWPREFDPVTGECLGRSVWEARTNRCLHSEDFGNAAWVKTDVTVATNQTIAPDGTLTADQLTASAGNGTVIQDLGAVASAAKTGALYLKRYTGTGNIEITLNGGSTWTAVTLTNTWTRFNLTATLADEDFGIRIVTSGDSIFAWGADVQGGAFMAPYIPTVASQVTRLADSAVMTGANFSSWFNPEQGCFVFDAADAVIGDATNNRHTVFEASDGTLNNRISAGKSAGGGTANFVYANVVAGGTEQAYFAPTGAITANTYYKFSASYKINEITASLAGGAVGSDTTAVIPVVDRLTVGRRSVGTNPFNGYIKRLTYYNQAFTAANHQAVTR